MREPCAPRRSLRVIWEITLRMASAGTMRQQYSRNWAATFFLRCLLDILLPTLLGRIFLASTRFQSKPLCCQGYCAWLKKWKGTTRDSRVVKLAKCQEPSEPESELSIELCFWPL